MFVVRTSYFIRAFCCTLTSLSYIHVDLLLLNHAKFEFEFECAVKLAVVGTAWVQLVFGSPHLGVHDDGINTLEPQLEPICEWIDKARVEGGLAGVHYDGGDGGLGMSWRGS